MPNVFLWPFPQIGYHFQDDKISTMRTCQVGRQDRSQSFLFDGLETLSETTPEGRKWTARLFSVNDVAGEVADETFQQSRGL